MLTCIVNKFFSPGCFFLMKQTTNMNFKLRRVLGIIFIILACILLLALLGQMREILEIIAGIVRIFFGKTDAGAIGYTIGQLTGLCLEGYLIYILIKYGRKWSKAQPDGDN